MMNEQEILVLNREPRPKALRTAPAVESRPLRRPTRASLSRSEKGAVAVFPTVAENPLNTRITQKTHSLTHSPTRLQ